ncbi:ParA family protein [Borrelia crocidurae]|uniref:Atpase, para family protein n=2 Tax=Borrelia crocidurae TaxID=29520 RepID=W5SKX5_9SPIR|nr:ParA family protein [Borrelia crocidurae]AFI32228.1 CobQ/CobB/MinD/ParA nucleotide binding domain protein [Borrelia crocidurae str. Achema]AHH07572.1 Atpase, para family protein [Borrelia crocidurae DOU]
MDIKKPKVITIASIKGGVGKSTTCLAFAFLLSRTNKVLIIDMDTQASVTSYYQDKIHENDIDLKNSNIYEVLVNELEIQKAVVNLDDNLFLIPSYLSLHKLNEDTIEFKELLLKSILACFCNNYDYIILDTAPSFDFISKNALLSSDCIIVPIIAEKWAVECLDLFDFFLSKLGLNLPVFLLITRFKKNNTHKEFLNLVKDRKNFLGIISEREDLNRAIASNSTFSLKKDYIHEYENAVSKFLSGI